MYKILMIDDDEFRLSDYSNFLKDSGFIVDSTSDIELFYSKTINSDYDAIICDIRLSAKNLFDEIDSDHDNKTGLALCKKIRDNGNDAKLIALTYSTLPEAVEWFSQNESVAYCHKDYYPPLEFAIALKNILDNPDIMFGELEQDDTLQHRILVTRNNIPNTNNEIIERLDKIIEAIESNDSKSFKSSVTDFLSLVANISGIISSIPTLMELISSLSKLF